MTFLHISWIFLAIISLHVVLGSTIHKRETVVQIAELDPIQQVCFFKRILVKIYVKNN